MKAVGRFGDTPDKVIIELGDDGYRLLGDARDVNRRNATDAIREVLTPGQRMTEKQLAENLKGRAKKTTVGDTLHDMLKDGELEREGGGSRGSPYVYLLSPTAPIPIGREKESDAKA
jgi:predicted HTH transcriptional regulator